MQPPSASRPHKNFIAAAVEERMARMQQAADSTTSSSPPLPPQPTKHKRNQDTLTIDLTDDNDDRNPPAGPHRNTPRLVQTQSPVDEQPLTPLRESPHSPLDSPASPSKMPSLLRTALNSATSPKPAVESPASPIEDAVNRKRKRETPPRPETNPQGLPTSPDSPIVDEGRRKKRGRLIVESPFSPIEQGEDPATSEQPAIESPQSPLQERNNGVSRNETRASSPHNPVETTAQSVHDLGAPARDTPTPNPTAKELEDELTHTEVSDRFIPETIDGVERRNPAKFSLKPAYWRPWHSKLYINFAEYLRQTVDPVPFAREFGVPVEEIAHMFQAVVCEPLYFPKEAAKRGEQGMQEIMELYRSKKYSTPKRPWGKEEGGKKRWLAEIKGVNKGEVELVLANSGNRKVLTLAELGEKDLKYLRDNLREEDKKVLWG